MGECGQHNNAGDSVWHLDLRSVVLVEPFAHYPGHYSVEVADLATALPAAGLFPIVVTRAGFLGEKSPRLNWDHVSQIKHRGSRGSRSLWRRYHQRFRFPLAMTGVNAWQTYRAMSLANRIAISRHAHIITCVSGDLLGFLIFALPRRGARLVCMLRDISRGTACRTIRAKLRRAVENALSKIVERRNHITYAAIGLELTRQYGDTGFQGRIRYVPPMGVNFPKRHYSQSSARALLGLPVADTLFLVFGTGHAGKDYESIVKWLAMSRPSNFSVLFAGASKGLNNASKLSRQYRCEEQVIVQDRFIPDEDVDLYFAAADCLLMSYRDEFTIESGVLVQGLAHALPIIASEAASINRHVRAGKLGFTFKPGDSHGLRQAVAQFLSLSAFERETLRSAVRTYAQSITWDEIAHRHRELYEELWAM